MITITSRQPPTATATTPTRKAAAASQRVLVAVDDSPYAPDVVAAAVEIALHTGAQICLFHAFTVPPDFPPAAHVVLSDPLPQYLRETALHHLEKLRTEAHLDRTTLQCDLQVDESATPWQAILAAAERYDADLVVLGSHGYKMMDRILGTTAAKVVDHATRNVFVVHRPLHRLPD